jgi:hypothetical protein|tara:strand:+ start:2679 stop:2924 length:246 start_codon:yes stop_codon:yes gene_type:complete
MKQTIQDSVLTALKNGSELTSKEIAGKFKAGNPQAVIQSLRFSGHAVYLNTKKNGIRKYRLGNPSRAVVAAGYKALATSTK